MVPAPSKPENPAILPRAPDITATSTKAPPIPAKPILISFHFIPAKTAKALAILPRALAPSTNVIAPTNPLSPASFPSNPETTASSVKTPPIPDNPRAISPQDILPTSTKASAISPRALAPSTITAAPIIPDNPPIFPTAIITALNTARAAPIATSERDIPPQLILPNLVRASAISSID